MKKYVTLFFVFVFTIGLYAQVRVLPDKVGIGTENPDSTLHVLGGVQIDGKLRLGKGDENIFIGFETGGINTTGENNIGIGAFAAGALISASDNIALGAGSLRDLTSGSSNIALGNSSLQDNVSGNNNIAIGQRAGQNTTGSGNVFLGNQAGFGESGSNKLYIANSSGTPLIYGDFDTERVGIGTTNPTRPLHIKGDPGGSIPVRIESTNTNGSTIDFKDPNTTGDFLARIGGKGDGLTFIAGGVQRMSISANGNLGIGTENPESKINIVNGTDANAVNGGYIINGSLNATNLAIDNNEIQGRNNGVVSGIAVNFEGGSVTLGGPTNDKRFRLSPDGNVGVGTTTPDSRFVVANGNTSNTRLFSVSNDRQVNVFGRLSIEDDAFTGNFEALEVYRRGPVSVTGSGGAIFANDQSTGSGSSDARTGVFAYVTGITTGIGRGLLGYSQTGATRYGVYGNVFTGGATTSYGVFSNGNLGYVGALINTSDRKLKKNIRQFEGLDILLQLKPKTYEYRKKEYARMNLPETTQYGFIAQELQEVLPELVYESVNAVEIIDRDNPSPSDKIEEVEYLGIDYINIIPIVTKAIQELSAENDKLKEKNELLEERLSKLEALVGSLTSSTIDLNTNETTISISDAQLFQNEPNPFSNHTKIQFFIPSKVNDAVMQIIGQNGEILKRIPIQKRGKGEIHLEAYALSAGNYRYTLILDGKIADSKQMILTE